MDAESLIHIEHPRDGDTRILARSMLSYGPNVGIPRIVETYRELGIKQTFFIPGWCIEKYPKAIEIILKGGHEIAHHGYLHENPRLQSLQMEGEWLDLGIDIIERSTGRRPRGWRAPLYNFSPNSGDLLVGRGFLYDASLMSDDRPYMLDTSNGLLVELPSHWGMDDWPQFVQSADLNYMMPIRSPEMGVAIFEQEFVAAHEYGALWVPVLHPFVTGRLARWSVFRKLLERIAGDGSVWFAPMEDIARHVLSVHEINPGLVRRDALLREAASQDPKSRLATFRAGQPGDSRFRRDRE
jgi:peptidoglycan/xylan/chitin deacetylase (PgdA/CDA1 family)